MLVALLRGVNVGGRNKVPMNLLRAALDGAASDGSASDGPVSDDTAQPVATVQTYLQSGNVISPGTDGAAFAATVHDTILREFGCDIAVQVRSDSELAAVVKWAPFAEIATANPKQVHVTFLDSLPDDDQTRRLNSLAAGDDRFEVHGREIALCFAGASHESKLARGVDRIFAPNATTRNWATVVALANLTALAEP